MLSHAILVTMWRSAFRVLSIVSAGPLKRRIVSRRDTRRGAKNRLHKCPMFDSTWLGDIGDQQIQTKRNNFPVVDSTRRRARQSLSKQPLLTAVSVRSSSADDDVWGKVVIF